ncbi:hypothetical protein HPB47_027962 [Ixodes persulcatus]|uniref:Uncharacterized protein n=1 Tax=Ixodes persulcatus TaxID=34615 RepID=A0AC60PWX2_IXOPE|nr:hypothetical protein HPB47_027962 [Ixodes persulcatus]
MDVAVEGEEIPADDFRIDEWTEIPRKKRALSLKSAVNTGNPNTAPEIISPVSRNSRPLRQAPPMECLPETDITIVLRPRGGLDLRYGCTTYRCTPFRHKTEACTQCWQRGHRPDVCPNATTRCPRCGIANPSEGHQCEPKCVLCGGAHLTGSAACPLRFKPHRPQSPPPEKEKEKEKKENTPMKSQNLQEWSALQERGHFRTKDPI